jgi:hypothetical protein
MTSKFMNPEATEWVFTKPAPFQELENRIRIFWKKDSVGYITFAVCVDDTGNKYLQGFLQMTKPIKANILEEQLGPAFYTPCFSSENYILTEILMNRSVSELGNMKSKDLENKKQAILSFKEDANTAICNVVEDIQRKHFDFFQCYPHIVIRYLQSPASAPKGGYPESFKHDANKAMCHAIETMRHKHPKLFHEHPKSVLRYLVS